jgi:alpha-ketoglutarate-dependent taurine dioxygenase
MTTNLVNIQLPVLERPLVQIEPVSSELELLKLETENVLSLFKQHGGILFRGFKVDLSAFSSFTDQFCTHYVSNESPGREMLSEDGRIQTVNIGERHFPLHPEMAREPWQPDVAWFNCESPAQIQGETNVCDGIAAAKAFPKELTKFLAKNKLAHTLPTTLAWCANYLKKPNLTITELSKYSTDELRFEIKNGELLRTYIRPMLHKPMFSEEWAYGNFLVFARKQLGIRNFPTLADGSEVPDEIVDEIERISNSLAFDIKWQKNDLVMLDNTRFMHGRNPIGDPQNRRIYTQFGYIKNN